MGVYIPNIKKPVNCIFCKYRKIETAVDNGELVEVAYCPFTGEYLDRYKTVCPIVELIEREDGLYERIN